MSRVRGRLLIGVISHCERADALANDVLKGVTGAEGAWLHDQGGNTRVRKPNSHNIQGGGEEEKTRCVLEFVLRSTHRSPFFLSP